MPKNIVAVLTTMLFALGGLYIAIPAPEKDTSAQLEPTVAVTETAASVEYTRAEKIGAVLMLGHWDNTPASTTLERINTYQAGGVIIMSTGADPAVVTQWTGLWQTDRETPLLIAIDQEGGVVSRLKTDDFTQTSQNEIGSVDEAYNVGATRGAELARLGINTNFAPVVEASVNPDSFLYDRVFRPSSIIPDYAAAMVRGLAQSNVTGVIKHYPGHADEPTDSHYTLPVLNLSPAEFTAHTQPFNTLIADQNITALMTAHVLVPAIDPDYPATLSHKILTEELREKQNYQGVIITDDMSMDAIDQQYATGEATVRALEAGADIILIAAEPHTITDAYQAIEAALDSGRLTEDRLDQSIERIQKLRR